MMILQPFYKPLNIKKSIIDLAIISTNMAPSLVFEVLPDCGSSDHFPILINSNHKSNHNSPSLFKTTPYKTRNLRKADWTLYHDKVLTEISLNHNTVTSLTQLNNIKNFAADQSIPKKTINNPNKISSPWWDDDCSELIKQRKRLLKNFKESPTLENFILAKKHIAFTKKEFRKKKKNSFINFCNNLNRTSNSSQVWKKINKFKGNNQKTFKHNISDEMREEILNNVAIIGYHPDFELSNPVQNIEPFNVNELYAALKSKKSSAPDMDEVSYEMLKYLPTQAKQILLSHYNSYLNGSPIPND